MVLPWFRGRKRERVPQPRRGERRRQAADPDRATEIEQRQGPAPGTTGPEGPKVRPKAGLFLNVPSATKTARPGQGIGGILRLPPPPRFR
jgi:hypothetical protein